MKNLVEFELHGSAFNSDDRQRVNSLKALLIDMEDVEDEEDVDRATALRQVFTEDELDRAAHSLERGVIASVEAIESIWFIVGEFLYIMSRAELWKYLDGEPNTMNAWAKMRELEYEDRPNHPLLKSYPLLSKWRLIYRRWFYELGRFEPDIVDAIRGVSNIDVLESYSRIISIEAPDVALEWAEDAQRETDQKRAGRKASIAEQLAAKKKKPAYLVRPSEANKELKRREKRHPMARIAQRVPKRYRGIIPNSAYVEEEVQAVSERETRVIIRVISDD